MGVGTYGATTGLASLAACTDCPPGSYCPEASSEPTECAQGTFSAFYNTEQAFSTMCDFADYECAYAEGSSCLLCSEGHFCPAGAVVAAECGAGNHSASGASSCSVCEAGYYCGSNANVQRRYLD